MLPQNNRLRQSSHFNRAYKRGIHLKGQFGKLVVFDRRDGQPARIGFVVSAKQGPAVVRNKAKRRLRGIFRELLPMLKPGHDSIYIVWSTEGSFEDMRSEIVMLLQRGRMLKTDETVSHSID
ncbi:MAG: ribonuclease P protein component [Candidatus Dojkabacteria bacterium]|nr:ribonuclease P protein component [Candidatus Dojkabacteria bacterium]